MEQIVKKQKGKDRYGDLGPFKHTLVKLKSKEKAFDTSVDNYINANYIRSAKQRSLFIATQGPLSNTFLNFWKMVWQEKVSLILMLCPLQEGGKTK
jgi:protein tyrosine phosphatase